MKSLRWIAWLCLMAVGIACSSRPPPADGRLYYTIQEKSHFRIEWTDSAGTQVHPLLGGQDEARSPAAAPDGRSLAYLRGSPPRVHVLDLVTKSDQQVSQTRDRVSRPAWDRTGRRLAYLCFPRRGKVRLVLQWTGGEAEVLYQALNLGLPTWSPVGSRILVSETDYAGRTSLLSMRVEGGEPEVVLEGATQPAMGMTGTQIALIREDKLQLGDLFNRQCRVLVDQPGISSPSWSPTGSQLAFVREGQIWVVNSDGSGIRQVTNSENPILDVSWGKGS
jgi:Tol biopolymer transport system component